MGHYELQGVLEEYRSDIDQIIVDLNGAEVILSILDSFFVQSIVNFLCWRWTGLDGLNRRVRK